MRNRRVRRQEICCRRFIAADLRPKGHESLAQGLPWEPSPTEARPESGAGIAATPKSGFLCALWSDSGAPTGRAAI
jgi:hypothetical protein